MRFIFILILLLDFQLNASDWRQVNDMDNNSGGIRAISSPDSNICYVLTQFSEFVRLYKSTDQGLNWNVVYQSDPFNEQKPYLMNAKTGISPHPNYYFYVTIEAPILLKSSNGGKSFSRIPLDTIDGKNSRRISDLSMLDTNIGFADSDDWYFITFDGWKTFQKNSKIIYDALYSPVFLNDSIVVMTYSSGFDEFDNLFKLYNIKQKKWEVLFEFKKEFDSKYQHTIQRIIFINKLLGFGCGNQRTGIGDNSYDLIYRTKDGGHNWEMVLKQLQYPSYGLQDIAFYDAKNGVAVGQGGKILTTKDSGSTWITNELPPEMYMPLTMKVAWAGQHPITGTFATGGGVFRYEGDFFDFTPDTTDVEERPDVKEIKLAENPYNLHLSPNPANDELNVSFFLNNPSNIEIEIFNYIGQIVNKTSYMNFESGMPSFKINLNNFNTGIYFCRANINGKIISKSFVVLK